MGADHEFSCVSVQQGHSQDVKMVAWHPSGELLISASYDNSIKLVSCVWVGAIPPPLAESTAKPALSVCAQWRSQPAPLPLARRRTWRLRRMLSRHAGPGRGGGGKHPCLAGAGCVVFSPLTWMQCNPNGGQTATEALQPAVERNGGSVVACRELGNPRLLTIFL
jgi:WD40 repeat protein